MAASPPTRQEPSCCSRSGSSLQAFLFAVSPTWSAFPHIFPAAAFSTSKLQQLQRPLLQEVPLTAGLSSLFAIPLCLFCHHYQELPGSVIW